MLPLPETIATGQRVQAAAEGGQPFFFTGEMVFPSHFEDFASLRPFAEVAAAVHEAEGWSSLYDPAQLARNTVPSAAAVYVEVPPPLPRKASPLTASVSLYLQ